MRDIQMVLERWGAWAAKEVAIKWSAAPDMTPQTVLYRRPVA
ncbi:antiterminator Q family protein, partial [Escherichia coli]